MKVKDLMSKKLFTVGPEDMLDKVFYLFNFEAIRHLPVIEKGQGGRGDLRPGYEKNHGRPQEDRYR